MVYAYADQGLGSKRVWLLAIGFKDEGSWFRIAMLRVEDSCKWGE